MTPLQGTSTIRLTMADDSGPFGALRCAVCGTSGSLDVEVIQLRCECSGAFTFVPPERQANPDILSPEGVPALLQDLIVRFAERDRIEVESAIEGFHNQAAFTHPMVLATLQGAVEDEDGALAGLECALKQVGSIRRKVRSRLVSGSALKLGSTIADALRFTAIFQSSRYAKSTQNVLWALEDAGHRILAEENSWLPGDTYSGLNYVICDSQGGFYELQFHTPDSFKIKNERNHDRYEEFRDPTTPPERKAELGRLMSSEWDQISIPPGITGFGGLDAERRYLG